MKRLFLLSLIVVILSSCASSETSYLRLADESDDINQRIEIYLNEIENGSKDMRAYYNLSYLYIYNEDYESAEKILLGGIELHRDTFRLYTALEYVYQRTREREKELDLLYKMLDLSYADEAIRSRILELKLEAEDPDTELALETLKYFPSNQMAINTLSLSIPFFESRAIINSTLNDINNKSLLTSRYFISTIINPAGYSDTFLTLNLGELISETSQSQSE